MSDQKEPTWILPYEDIFKIEKNLIGGLKEGEKPFTEKELAHITAKLAGEFAQLKILMHLRTASGKYGTVPLSTVTSCIQQLENMLGIKWPEKK